MEINSEIISGLKLVNSSHINKDDLLQIFVDCNKGLFGANEDRDSTNGQTTTDDRLILMNAITFSVKALMLESAKHNVNESSSLVHRLTQDYNLDCNTDNFKLLIQFINSTLKKVCHNVQNLELNPLPKYKNLEWSQSLDIKSSIVDSIKEKSYIIDLQVGGDVDEQYANKQQDQVFSMAVSSKELQDLYSTLRDCVKNVENFVNK